MIYDKNQEQSHYKNIWKSYNLFKKSDMFQVTTKETYYQLPNLKPKTKNKQQQNPYSSAG